MLQSILQPNQYSIYSQSLISTDLTSNDIFNTNELSTHILNCNTANIGAEVNQFKIGTVEPSTVIYAQDTAPKTITFPATNGVNAIVQYQGTGPTPDVNYLYITPLITSAVGTSFSIINAYFVFSRISTVTTMSFNLIMNNLVGFTNLGQTYLGIQMTIPSQIIFNNNNIYSNIMTFSNAQQNLANSGAQSLSISSSLSSNFLQIGLILNAIPLGAIQYQLTGSLVFNATF
jgi:hypothetical protein